MTSQIQVNLNPQSVSQKTHPEVAGQLQGTVKRWRSGWFPNGWDDPPPHQHMNSFWLTKPSQAAFHGQSPCPQQWPMLWREQQIHLLLIALSLTEFLQWDIRAWASLGPETRHPGFWPGSSLRRDLKGRRKKQWENRERDPLHSLPENLLNI